MAMKMRESDVRPGRSRWPAWVLAPAVLAAALAAASSRAGDDPKGQKEPKPLRVLFIGNSYTSANDLAGCVVKLGASAKPSVRIEVARHTPGGATLQQHWEKGEAVTKIREGGWDYVVLQEGSLMPVINPQCMHEYARKLDAEIKKAGAKTVFYMTWARRDKPEMTQVVAKAYTAIARELGAKVAPVGLAWAEAITQKGDLVLHRADKSHPNQQGTYLAACTFYAALTGSDPRGLSDADLKEVTAEQAAFLQQVAWQSVRKAR